MKKILTAAIILTCLTVMHTAKAQQDVLIEREQINGEKRGADNKKSEEIIIRKMGDKDINLKVEINGEKIRVNGKPLSAFKDKDITISKRLMTITDDGDYRLNFDQRGEDNFDMPDHNFRNFSWNHDEGANKGLLGVTTNDVEGGAVITEVVKGSAADKAGLKEEDIILQVGDEKIASSATLSKVVGAKKPKEEVKITYKRDGKQSITKATLGSRGAKFFGTFRFNGPASGDHPSGPELGDVNMEGYTDDIRELTQNALADAFPFRKKIGLKIQDTEDGANVKVINVEDSSAAAIAGVKQGDLITEINGTKVENTDDAREELMPDEDKKSYKIKALRNGVEMLFDVKIPKKLKTANL